MHTVNNGSDPEDTSEELTEAVCLESDLQDGQ